MKRRSICLALLMLAAVLTWTACSTDSKALQETEKPTVAAVQKDEIVETVSDEKQEPDKIETQEVALIKPPKFESAAPQENAKPERITYPFEEGYVPQSVPFAETVLDAQMIYSNADDELAYWIYAPADEDTLRAYLKLCAYSGVVSIAQVGSDDTVAYELTQLGSDFSGILYLDEAEERLTVIVGRDSTIFTDETLEELMTYYLQELTLPVEEGRNVMPQFYASAGQNPYFQNQTGNLSYCFDDAMHWTEWYDGIDLAKMWRYTSDMLLCGFDVWLDDYKADDNGCVQLALLHFSNGDAEVIVLYDAEDESADVHYKPGVSYNLLSGSNYLKYIP